jgi:5-methylcytosine-specific restriction endonuclease McrA
VWRSTLDFVKQTLAKLHTAIVELLQAHPEGLSEGEMRSLLGIPGHKQVQFGRRRRELHAFYEIEKIREGSEVKYRLKRVRERPTDSEPISQRLRANALRDAHARCQMCGRTIEQHGITLVVDHKIPRSWGGKTEAENLWALCEDCNAGKKDLFSSIDSPQIRAAIVHDSPHVRIGELLKAAGIGNPVPSELIHFVADQDQWDKRLRELRYLGWEIQAKTKKSPAGKNRSFYILRRYTEWPPDPSRWIQKYERERELRNKKAH